MTTSERIQVLLHAGIEERTIAAILGAEFADVVHFTRDPSFDVPVFDLGDINLAPYARLDGATFTGEVDGTDFGGNFWGGFLQGQAPLSHGFGDDAALSIFGPGPGPVEPTFRLFGDGTMAWSPAVVGGGAWGYDTALFRDGTQLELVNPGGFWAHLEDWSAYSGLHSDGGIELFLVADHPAILAHSDSAIPLASEAIRLVAADDADARFVQHWDGSLHWGDGALAPDLAMWRAGGLLNLGPESEVGQPHPAAVQVGSDASLLVAAHGAVAHPSWAYLDPAGYFEAAVAGDPATSHVFSTGPAPEPNWRYDIRADGTMRWGGGIDPADVILQRTGPGVLVMGDRTYTEPVVQFATAGGTANIYLQNDGTDAYIDMNPGDPLTIVVGKKGGGIQLRSPDGLTRKTLTIDNAGALALV